MWGQQSYRSTTLKQLFDNDDRFFGTRVKQYASATLKKETSFIWNGFMT